MRQTAVVVTDAGPPTAAYRGCKEAGKTDSISVRGWAKLTAVYSGSRSFLSPVETASRLLEAFGFLSRKVLVAPPGEPRSSLSGSIRTSQQRQSESSSKGNPFLMAIDLSNCNATAPSF
jgi:hypothetical protein